MVALVIATITGMGAATSYWTHERSEKLYREIDADIQHTLWQHERRKLAAVESEGPATTGTSAKSDEKPDAKQAPDKARSDARSDVKARKAKIASIRKRASGHRRERFVPPDFARLPIAIARGAFGFLP